MKPETMDFITKEQNRITREFLNKGIKVQVLAVIQPHEDSRPDDFVMRIKVLNY